MKKHYSTVTPPLRVGGDKRRRGELSLEQL